MTSVEIEEIVEKSGLIDMREAILYLDDKGFLEAALPGVQHRTARKDSMAQPRCITARMIGKSAKSWTF